MTEKRDRTMSRAAVTTFLVVTVVIAVLPGTAFPQHPTASDEGGSSETATYSNDAVARSLDSLGGYFIENRGQVNDLVRYYSRGNPSVAFRDDGVMFVITEPSAKDRRESWDVPVDHTASIDETATVRRLAYMLRFEGANDVTPIGINRLPFDSNFFIGNDPSKWRTAVPNYGEVVYEGIYPGIDLVYRPTANGVKYEFVIRPGASPEDIMIRYEGIKSLKVDGGGMLVLTAFGDIRDSSPFSYHLAGDAVACTFAFHDSLSHGFSCRGRDPSQTLVIDPVVYATFLGGSGFDDIAFSVATDSDGNAYVAGRTADSDFPTTPGAFELTLRGLKDATVTKLNPTGSLVYSTFIGGSGHDNAHDIAVDSRGEAFITGGTNSSDFPTTQGTYDNTSDGYDAIVVRLNPTGSSLVYSTYLGGTADESGDGIAADSSGAAYVTGGTSSADFPTTLGAYDTGLNPTSDAFVTKLSSDGGTLLYSTFIGGSSTGEYAYSIAVDSGGNAYITGLTNSVDFPVTAGAYDTTYNGGRDTFVVKLNAAGNALLYSTFLGGSGFDDPRGIDIDPSGSAYVMGMTDSPDYPVTPGAFDVILNNGGLDSDDLFVTKMSVNGSALNYSTFLGGDEDEWAGAIVVTSAGYAYVTGGTYSANFPVTPGATDGTYNGGLDSIATAVQLNGSGLYFSTFIGGSAHDHPRGIDVDPFKRITVVGDTRSSDFPTTPGAFQTNISGVRDMFVIKIEPPVPPGPPDIAVFSSRIYFNPPGPVDFGTSVLVGAMVMNLGYENAIQVVIRFYDGQPSGTNQIDTDRIIPVLSPIFPAMADVPWIADAPAGIHDICVVADPDNTIAETDETNNQACAQIEVIVPPLPDLTVSSSDILLSPSPPYVEGTLVDIDATVHNVCTNVSGTTVARFFDGTPPSPQIGTDQPLGPIPANGSLDVSVYWSASGPGGHLICVVADPDDVVSELDETNNVACVNVVVQPGPVIRPDYVYVSPQPLPPIKVGLSSSLSLSIQVLNQGNGTATGNAVVAFYEDSPPVAPFVTFTLAPLPPATTSSPFTANWNSPAASGTYLVSVNVDYYDNVTEWDETNNVYTWTIEVVEGPITSLIIGNPNHTAATTYVRSSTPLDFSVVDQSGMGIMNTTYRIDGGQWVNYTSSGTFTLAGEGGHTVEWFSVDYAGNTEVVNSIVLTVDDTPPVTNMVIGDPKHLVGGNFVTSSTSLTLQAVDGGITPVGLDFTEYGIDGGGWVVYSSPFTLTGEGTHVVEYRSHDLLTNEETTNSIQLMVDDTPPATTVSVGEPKYQDVELYITSNTEIDLTSLDGGVTPVGLDVIQYRIDGGTWQQYASSLTLTGNDGPHVIEYDSTDLLGNTESANTVTLNLDNTPPATAVSPATGPYTLDTIFTLTATDSGCGVNVTRYRIDGGALAEYSSGFTLPEGNHNISFFSVDNLDNTEPEKWLAVMVLAPPPPSVEANYKPLVALIFAVVLAVTGLWSSRRKPWKGGNGRMAVAKAFAITCLPFILAEILTGILSVFVDSLKIPPVIGWGTSVDVLILVAGVLFSLLRLARKDGGMKPQGTNAR